MTNISDKLYRTILPKGRVVLTDVPVQPQEAQRAASHITLPLSRMAEIHDRLRYRDVIRANHIRFPVEEGYVLDFLLTHAEDGVACWVIQLQRSENTVRGELITRQPWEEIVALFDVGSLGKISLPQHETYKDLSVLVTRRSSSGESHAESDPATGR